MEGGAVRPLSPASLPEPDTPSRLGRVLPGAALARPVAGVAGGRRRRPSAVR